MARKYKNLQQKFRARDLRKQMTDAERKLWSKLRGKQIEGLQFYRQRPLGRYIVDFYCPKKRIVVEVDGGQHYDDIAIEKDKRRSDDLKRMFDLKVLRFTNIEVLKNMEGVMQKIIEETE